MRKPTDTTVRLMTGNPRADGTTAHKLESIPALIPDYNNVRTDWLITEIDRLESAGAKNITLGDLQALRNELCRREPIADDPTNVVREELDDSWR